LRAAGRLVGEGWVRRVRLAIHRLRGRTASLGSGRLGNSRRGKNRNGCSYCERKAHKRSPHL
jgi:hypothetical protein